MYGIIGREESRCGKILEQLPTLRQVECIPFIETVMIPQVSLPVSPQAPEVVTIFTSPRSVQHYAEAALPLPVKTATLGDATAQALKKHLGIEPWWAWQGASTSIAFAQGLLEVLPKATTLLQPTSSIAGEAILEACKAAGHIYHLVPLYTTTPHPMLAERLKELSAPLDFALFFSSSGVEAWHEALPTGALSDHFTALSIGPQCTRSLQKRGYQRILEATTPQPHDLAALIIKVATLQQL